MMRSTVATDAATRLSRDEDARQLTARANLRLALAMRGGVSLAVWIGGACAEIDFLRRSIRNRSSTVHLGDGALYRTLLSAAGYEHVAVDVISGASAGGLNGAILCTTLAYGVPFDEMRNLWIDLADISHMVRKPSERRPPSVLQGDEYFLKKLEHTLTGLIHEAQEAKDDKDDQDEERIDLFLAATLIKGVKVPVYEDPFAGIVENRQSAVFHFRKHGPATCLTDFGPSAKTAARRLALAARATSSFPGAFEPATIHSYRPSIVGRRPDDAEPDDLFGIFSESAEEPFHVIDGGVLDNIPVARAIEAIADAPAFSPTQRWLLFLHPSPEVASESIRRDPLAAIGTPTARKDGPTALRTVLAAMSTKSNRESLLDDIAVLREHQKWAQAFPSVRKELVPITKDATPASVIAAAESRYQEYRRRRGDKVASLIIKLLRDPTYALNEDPFPVDLGSPLACWSTDQVGELESAIAKARYNWLPETLPSDDRFPELDFGALWRTADLLIEWIHSLEARVKRDDTEAHECLAFIGILKRGLYDVKSIAVMLIHYDDIAWPMFAAGRLASLRGDEERMANWASIAFRFATRVLRMHPRGGDAKDMILGLLGYLELAGRSAAGMESDEVLREQQRLANLTAEALCGLERRIGREITDLTSKGQTLDEITERISEAESLGEHLDFREAMMHYVVLATQRVAEKALEWKTLLRAEQQPVFQVLEKVHSNSKQVTAKLLAAVEVLTYPLIALFDGRRPQPIGFRRVAATNPSPLEYLFPDSQLTMRDKLAGNELANFAAFYKGSWRANDWMWGRMDAVVSLIDILIQPNRIKLHWPQDGESPFAQAQRFVEQIERLVTASLPIDLTPAQVARWNNHFKELWARRKAGVEWEAKRLFGAVPDASASPSVSTIRTVLVERRQWEILLSELPKIVETAVSEELAEGMPLVRPPESGSESTGWSERAWRRMAGSIGRVASRFMIRSRRIRPEPLPFAVAAIRASGKDPLHDPEGIKALLGHYRVGRETIRDEIGTKRLARVATDVSVVGWNAFNNPPLPLPLRPVGWFLKVLRLITLAVTRAPSGSFRSCPRRS